MENNTQEDEIKAHLLATNERFRELAQQHAQLSRQIDDIEARARVSDADEVEEQRLKKLKLSAKDQMNEILADHRHSHVA